MRLSLFFPEAFPDPAWAEKTYFLEALEGESAEWVLGRYPDCQLVLRVRPVSRHHAVIRFSKASKRWTIEDLSSTYGTSLNGKGLKPAEPYPLAIGDRFYLANPSTTICVVENEQDTVNTEVQAAQDEVVSASSKTFADALYLALEWLFSAQTYRGKIYRFCVAIIMAALVAAVVILVS